MGFDFGDDDDDDEGMAQPQNDLQARFGLEQDLKDVEEYVEEYD